MLYFLHGPDNFRSRQKLNEIIEAYRKTHKSGLNLKRLDAAAVDFQDFKNEVECLSMFGEKKLIILEGVSLNKLFCEKLKECVSKTKIAKDEDIILVVYERREIDKRKFSFLIKTAQSQEFEILSGRKLKNWAEEYSKQLQLQLSDKMIEMILGCIGNNLWRLSCELQKLADFTKGRKVTSEDIALMLAPQVNLDIFKTIDALASKNKKAAQKLIFQHLDQGENELYLLTMICYQFRNLLKIKSRFQQSGIARVAKINQLSRELGMHPFVVRKTLFQAKKFDLEELKKSYYKLLEVDFNIKTGQVDPRTALTMLVQEI